MKRDVATYALASALVMGSALIATAQASPPGNTHHHPMHHVKHQSRGGTCGENMYWSTKEHHCVDARDKSKGGWIPF